MKFNLVFLLLLMALLPDSLCSIYRALMKMRACQREQLYEVTRISGNPKNLEPDSYRIFVTFYK